MVKKVIETFDLSKIYKLKGKKRRIQALKDINLSIEKGEIFGLLGPNGAGKTTMIEIFTTLKQPTSGYALIDGFNVLKEPNKAKAKVALMLESHMLYYRMTAYANLKFFCKLYGIKNYKEKIEAKMKEFQLEGWANQYIETFSTGMRMKLALCRTLLLERNILFLDEPTVGLDVTNVAYVVKKLKNLNKTIFLTSHDMSVVEKLCDRIAFINKGEIIKIGTKETLSKLIQSEIRVEIEINENKNKLKSELNQENSVNDITETNRGLICGFKERRNYNVLLSILSKYNIMKVKELDLSLEELFVKLI